MVDVISAFEAWREGNYPVFLLRLSLGIVGAGIALAMLFGFVSAGVGFVVFLILAGLSLFGEWIINMIRDDKVERWLSSTPFGTKSGNPFESLAAQNDAWQAFVGIVNGEGL